MYVAKQKGVKPGPEAIHFFHAQLGLQLTMFMNVKMPTIVEGSTVAQW